MKTPMEKLAAVKTSLIMLKPYLTPEWRETMDACIKYCRDLEEHLTIIDKDDDANETVD